MKFKCFKIRYTTWKKLRRAFPKYRNETFNDYIKRLVRGLENDEN